MAKYVDAFRLVRIFMDFLNYVATHALMYQRALRGSRELCPTWLSGADGWVGNQVSLKRSTSDAVPSLSVHVASWVYLLTTMYCFRVFFRRAVEMMPQGMCQPVSLRKRATRIHGDFGGHGSSLLKVRDDLREGLGFGGSAR